MDASFQEKCLETHRDLLQLQREVHRWMNELTGFEVAGERPPRPNQRPGRPPRPDRTMPRQGERQLMPRRG